PAPAANPQQTPAAKPQQSPAAKAQQASAAKGQKAPTAKTRSATSQRSQTALALKTQTDKVSYAIGLNIGRSLHKDSLEVDPNILVRGLKDGLAGGKPLLTDDETKAAVTTPHT